MEKVKNTEFIIELANCHGGNIDYIESLIQEFSNFKGHGMKFQPLHPDFIAIKEFEWYNVYQELLIEESDWGKIIESASLNHKVWLDLFDVYGTKILNDNLNNIYGIKLQASILYNLEVLEDLQKMDCSELKLIINISALTVEEIKERVQYFESVINPQELLIEVGFQSYPTVLEDSGVSKIKYLKDNFDNRVVFADHVDGKSEDAIDLPFMAVFNGADVIEKHVMHSALESKYDFYSAVDYKKYGILVDKIGKYQSLLEKAFINDKEIDYLKNSIQIPLAKGKLKSGDLLNFDTDIVFRRAGLPGLNFQELTELKNDFHLLSEDVEANKPIKAEHLKKANIATIIACRLKSSRLKSKALLKVGDLTSVELCIKSCLRFKNVNHTILATSNVEQDAPLKDYLFNDSVVFHRGDPDDVISRYLGVIDDLNIDVIVRVTADMPYVSSEIVDLLLESHFKTGSDYTVTENCSVGTGVEIINASALRKVKSYFPSAEYSEYMTWYFQNNPEYFQINKVELPDNLLRDYRLTLDYQEDLDLFNNIESYLSENKLDSRLPNVFKYLDENPEIAQINAHIGLKYKTDENLINTLNEKTKIKN